MKRIAVVAVLVSLSGCGGRDESQPARDSVNIGAASATPSAAHVDSTRPGSREVCPATGRWALCSLETRLRRSGFVAKKVEGESPMRPGFSVAPVVYTLGHGRLEVFLYEDDAALAKDVAGIDTVTVAPPGAAAAWPSAPGLVRSGNLAAVFMDQNARQAERLVLAITAGAPSAR